MLSTDGWQYAVAAGVGSRDVAAKGKVKNTGSVDTEYRAILAISRYSQANKLLETYSDFKDVTLKPGVTSDPITLGKTGIVTAAGEYLLMKIHLNSLAPTKGELEVTDPPWRFDEPLVDGELVGDWTPAVS